MILLLYFKETTDPSLIPIKPESGCPNPSYEYGNLCCCARACCWNNCRLNTPPECALKEVDAEWKWDEKQQMFKAQKSKYRRTFNL